MLLRKHVATSAAAQSASPVLGFPRKAVWLHVAGFARTSQRLARVRSLPRAERLCLTALWLAVAIYCVVFLRLTFRLADNLGIRSYDLAIFDQATWLISRGQTPFVTVRGLHILAEHFSALLYLLAPLYWIWDSPKILLAAQTVALALGALPVYALARHRTGSTPLSLAFGVAYLLYPPLQWSNAFEFHPDTFATPCLLGAFYYLTRNASRRSISGDESLAQNRLAARSWGGYFLLLSLALLAKETVGLVVVALGLYALSVNRRIGWLTIGLGLLGLAIALATVSFFNQGRPSLFFLLYDRYGHSPGAILVFLLHHPLSVLADLNTGPKRLYLFQLLYPVMFLALLAPEVMLIALPALLLHLLSAHGIMYTIYFQYSALITPFVFAAAIFGFERCRRWGNRETQVILALCLVWGMVQGAAQRPVSGRSLPPLLSQARIQATQRILSLIPAEASVSTQVALMPHLGHRNRLFLFPNPFQKAAWGYGAAAMQQMGAQGYSKPHSAEIQKAAAAASVEYVALCPATTAFPLPPTDPLYPRFVVPLLQSPAYGIIAIGQDTLLLRRGASHQQGLRLLAQRAGRRIAQEQDVAKAFQAWTARQTPGIGAGKTAAISNCACGQAETSQTETARQPALFKPALSKPTSSRPEHLSGQDQQKESGTNASHE